jgi:DNA phosphorothioation-associated putative methyltransferase
MTVTIARHKTAMSRNMLSRPVARALGDGIIEEDSRVLDYGCGRGGDVARLERLGIHCDGYDPVYRPSTIRTASDVVNLGYVLNVIEDVGERARTLKRTWDLTIRCLVVSGRLESEAKGLEGASHRDGIVTTAGTFQKFFTQTELRDFIEHTLQQHATAAAPGVFYVFRDPTAEQGFLARRVRRTSASRSRIVLEQHEDLLVSLVLPRGDERSQFAELEAELGSVRSAFSFVRRATGDERWDRIRVGRSEDLLVYLALSRFARRPAIGALPPVLQNDIRDFFGSYKAACAQGDRLLFAISETARVNEAMRAAPVGKRTRDALYVHTSALAELAPILRVLEGCGRVLLGAVDDATLVKFSADRPVLSYLGYGDFDNDPHPALKFAYVSHLDSLHLDYRDYSEHANPPILHRKELFVAEGYPTRERFARLTRQEIAHGLYRDPTRIGTRNGWAEALASRGVQHRGHSIVRIAKSD